MDRVTGVMATIESCSEHAASRETERKFVVAPLAAARFIARIEARTALEITDPSRPVEFNRTTYLDTPDHYYLRSSHTGLARKLRIREYACAAAEGLPPEPTNAFLELKESGGGFRSKTRVRLDRPIAALLESDPDSPALQMFRSIFEEQRPVPMLTTRYRRVRRACLDSAVRVTVDSQVCFMPPTDLGAALRFDRPVYRIPSSIIEIKAAGPLPDWLLAELDFAHEDGSFSKFEQGMKLLGELT